MMGKDHGKIRDLLFADQPLAELVLPRGSIYANSFPSSAFAAAYAKQRQGDIAAARAELHRVASAPGLETRQYLRAWHALRELGEEPPPELARKVLGVVIEAGFERGLDSLAAYSDHRARYLSQGGGIFWEASEPAIDQRIDVLLQAAQDLVHDSGRPQELRPPPPARGIGRVSVLTLGGIHSVEGILADRSFLPSVITSGGLLLQALAAKQQDRNRHAQLPGPVMKISLDEDDTVYVDGSPSSIPALRESLKGLKESHGVVCLFRRPPVEKPSPGLREVFDLVMQARISMRFSRRPDFSDAIGPDGRLIKRE
jgi:hypothetical protein